MSFQVCEGKCDQCLFTKDRIVSAARMRNILQGCRQQDIHFVCHKASIAGRDVCCRGFYDTQTSQMIRIAERLNMVEFVDPATGRPAAQAAPHHTAKGSRDE
jgi:hypothetical protein